MITITIDDSTPEMQNDKRLAVVLTTLAIRIAKGDVKGSEDIFDNDRKKVGRFEFEPPKAA